MTRREDMSIKDLAYKIRVSPTTLGRWFAKCDMPISAAEKIIEILQIPKSEQATIFFDSIVSHHATK